MSSPLSKRGCPANPSGSGDDQCSSVPSLAISRPLSRIRPWDNADTDKGRGAVKGCKPFSRDPKLLNSPTDHLQGQLPLQTLVFLSREDSRAIGLTWVERLLQR